MCQLGPYNANNQRRTSLLDSIIYFIDNNFEEYNDTFNFEKKGITWEFHRTFDVINQDFGGCCSSTCTWLCNELKDNYEDVGILSFIRPNGTGHTLNYILHNEYYYIVDLLPYTNNYPKVIKESGIKSDFLQTNYVTGCCLKTSNLDSFAFFYGRIQATKGFDHLFFQIEERAVPPCSFVKKGNDNYLLYPTRKKIKKLNGFKEKNLKFDFIDIDFDRDEIPNGYFI
jgi:hypothetical protein